MLHASYAQNGHGSSFLRLFVGRCSAGSWGTTICLKSRGKQGETPFVFRCIPAPVPPWTWAIYKAEKADDVLSQSCPENKCFKSVLGRPIFTYPYLVHSSTM